MRTSFNTPLAIRDEMKILIINDLDPIFQEKLASIPGLELDYRPQIKLAEVPAALHGAEGLVLRSKMYVTKEIMDDNPQLRFIARAGSGTDNIDVEEAQKHNIAIFNAPEGNRDAVGEHLIGMLLMLMNKLNQSHSEVVQKVWLREGNRGYELKGKTVGIIGYGNNGSATAEKLSGFGCKVLAYDKYKSGFQSEYADEVGMDTIFREADILSLHIPLTQETQQLVDDDFFEKFHKPIIFMNAARGKILRLLSLKHAMESGKVIGACLDVLENENLDSLSEEQERAFNYLRATHRVIFSPHVAGWTVESYRKISEVLADKILAFLKEN